MVIRKLRTMLSLFILLIVGLMVHSSVAEEPAKVGAEIVQKASATAKEATKIATNKLAKALKGDHDAALELATEYLLPAGIALLALIVGYMAASFSGRMVGLAVARRVDLTLGKFLSKMIKNMIILMVFLGVLGYFGVDVTSFAAILAACGFAIGMALQGTLSNFAAGVMLLVFRPFRVGDYIKVSDVEGTVDEIDLFTTRLNSRDNRHLILPNSSVFGSTIENVTHNAHRRVDVNVGVSYDADIAMTRRVLEQAISTVAGTMAHPAPQIYLKGLGDSAVNWEIRVWCRSDTYWEVRERTVAAAKQGLDTAGISIPFPQMDIHVVSNMVSEVTTTDRLGQSERRAAA